MAGNTFLPKAGPLGTAIGMLLASLVMIIIALNYNFMINKPVLRRDFCRGVLRIMGADAVFFRKDVFNAPLLQKISREHSRHSAADYEHVGFYVAVKTVKLRKKSFLPY